MSSLHMPQLFVFLGAGGVGKTTLSAAFAISLAMSGKKVGLISIDPAKRLRSALGVESLSEEGSVIPLPENTTKGELRAALFHVEDTLQRWVLESNMAHQERTKLFENPYFAALTGRFASALDTFAAIRMVEWYEQYPDTEYLVIDTAPGIHAVDFLTKPEKLSVFLDSKLIEWLKWFVLDAKGAKQNMLVRLVKSSAKKILEGLSLVGGEGFLLNFGEFLMMIDVIFEKASKRLQRAQEWISEDRTAAVVVTSVRSDAAAVAFELGRILKSMDMKNIFYVINRSFPLALKNDPVFAQFTQEISSSNKVFSENPFARYLFHYQQMEDTLTKQCRASGSDAISVHLAPSLDNKLELRMMDLAALGLPLVERITK